MGREIRADSTVEADLTVIGAGGAALIGALEARSLGVRVAILHCGEGATPEVSALNVTDPEDQASFYEDILRGGEYLSQKGLVRRLVEGAAEILGDLERLNINLACKEGKYIKRLASGSSHPRSVFLSEESIGTAVSRALKNLLITQKIPTYPNLRACKILKNPSGSVCGVLGIHVETGRVIHFQSQAVLIATGGIGRLYPFSTYPRDVSGDGLALAYEIGAELIDMEFIQYEPTVILHPPSARGLLMPTVLLGDGAVLLNRYQKRFMLERDPIRREKNQKHVLALAIEEEVAQGNGSTHGGVYFDCRPIPHGILEGYSELTSRLAGLGIDITQGPVEVGPVAHSFMGGIRIQEDGSTNVPGLYAAGEVAGGIWGANRIAGTGATEILVFGKIAGRAASSYAGSARAQKATEDFFVPDGDRDPSAVFPKIQRLLADGGGLGRSQAGIDRGIQELEKIEKDELKHINTRALSRFLTYMSTANGWAVAKMVLTAARQRKETRGFHQRLDYPQKNDGEFLGNFILQKGDHHQLTVKFVPNHG